MKILRLISSLRGNESMSLQLGNVIVEQLKKQNPKAIVSLRNLVQNEVPHLKEVHLTSFMTQPEKLTPTLTLAKSYSDTAINELLAADVVVIDVPMYNFTIPSSLKAWIDHIVRAGITFKYSENGVEGLVKDKQVFLAIATGGIYSDGPLQTFDHTESYLKKILGFIGITDITTFRVEGTALPEYKVNALTKAIQSVSSYNFTSL